MLRERNESWTFFCDLYETLTITQAVIFLNTRHKVDWLRENAWQGLQSFFCAWWHKSEGKSCNHEGTPVRIKLCSDLTDLLGCATDIQQGSLIIIYDLLTNHENDDHRSGRWGLFGRKSVAINFATEEEKKILYDFETFYNSTVEQILMNVAELI